MSMRAEGRGAVMRLKWVLVLCMALSIVFLTTGCSEEVPVGGPATSDFLKEREALAAREKPKSKSAPKPSAAARADSAAESDETDYASGERDYFYDPRDKRDPFRSFRFAEDDSSKTSEFGPLGDFGLEQLELSAVIWDATNPRALILDPGGRSYIVSEGSQIGKNSGHVIHIGDNLVLVKETYENLAGDQTTKDVELRISLSQGG